MIILSSLISSIFYTESYTNNQGTDIYLEDNGFKKVTECYNYISLFYSL